MAHTLLCALLTALTRLVVSETCGAQDPTSGVVYGVYLNNAPLLTNNPSQAMSASNFTLGGSELSIAFTFQMPSLGLFTWSQGAPLLTLSQSLMGGFFWLTAAAMSNALVANVIWATANYNTRIVTSNSAPLSTPLNVATGTWVTAVLTISSSGNMTLYAKNQYMSASNWIGASQLPKLLAGNYMLI